MKRIQQLETLIIENNLGSESVEFLEMMNLTYNL